MAKNKCKKLEHLVVEKNIWHSKTQHQPSKSKGLPSLKNRFANSN